MKQPSDESSKRYSLGEYYWIQTPDSLNKLSKKSMTASYEDFLWVMEKERLNHREVSPGELINLQFCGCFVLAILKTTPVQGLQQVSQRVWR